MKKIAKALNCSKTNVQKLCSELLHEGLLETKIKQEEVVLYENEEFRSLERFKCSKYSISNYGRIKNSDNKIMKLIKDRNGYLNAKLFSDEDEYRSFLVHRLVAIMFIENNDPYKTEVDHIDSNKENNKVDNLQWLSCVQNSRKSNAKHTEEEIRKVCELLEQKIKIVDILILCNNFTYNSIFNIKSRKIWKDISRNYNF